MSIFSAIKNAFDKPVDVDIISETVFKESDKLIPVKLKLANKDKKQDIIISNLNVSLESREDLPTDSNRVADMHTLYEENKPMNMILPVSGEPINYDFIIDYSFANALKTLVDDKLPPDNPLKDIVGIASKIEKYGSMLSTKRYKYFLYISVFSQDKKVGKTSKQIILTKPGEIAFNNSFNLFNI